jgi:unsaturated rhamnogalacturonyl hydrolase
VIDPVLLAMLAMQRLSWEQGIAAHAALDLGLDDLVVLLAEAAVTRQAPDGRLGTVDAESGVVNGAACGEAVLHAARLTGDPRWRVAAAGQLGWLTARAPRAADGTLFHLLSNRQVWVDSVYMVVPLLAMAGRPDLAVGQLDGHRRRLYDPGSGLYAAVWDEDAGVLARADHWATGNGWVVAGIARALRHAPGWPAEVAGRLAAHATEVIDACLALRGADGLFHDVLDDPATFPEANTAQMLAYAVLTGVADGWLGAGYREVGHDLLATARRTVDGRGLVTRACG